jgi:hypothetical protein
MRFTIIIISLSVFLISFAGCQKDAGEGGTGVITGKVYARSVKNGFLVGEFYAPDERVYIMYGNSTVYNDDMDTHYDGTYRFSYLYPGNYTIYCYSECDSCVSEVEPIIANVEITKEGEIVEVPDIVIQK